MNYGHRRHGRLSLISQSIRRKKMKISLNILSRCGKRLFGAMAVLFFFTSPAPAMNIVGQWGTGEYTDVKTLGTICCCAASGSGIDIIDVADSSNPSLLANFDTSGESHGVFMSGSLVYIADGGNGLQIVDISNPAKPKLLGHLYTNDAHKVVVAGDKAYIADNLSGLSIVDVSNPETPTLLGFYNSPGYAVDIFVSGTTAYLADDISGLQIIDVSDPAQPVLSGSYASAKRASGVWVDGDTAYIADSNQGLLIVNVKDPAHPSLISSTNTTQALKVQVIGNRAYVVNPAKGLQCFDVSDLKNPKLLSSGTAGHIVRGFAQNIFISGTTAYIAFGAAGLRLINISDPAAPTKLGFYNNFSGYAADVWVEGSIAYMAALVSGLQIIDVSKPETPFRLGNFDEYTGAVQVVGNKAYVGGIRNFYIVDVSNPAAPVELGRCPISDEARNVHVTNSLAYIAEGFSGLQIVSISTPDKPEVIASYSMPGYSTVKIKVADATAYVADSDKGLEVIDLHHIRPYTPRIIGHFDTPGDAEGIDLAGSTAYIADNYEGLQIIDITDPSTPSLISNYRTMANNMGVQVVGSRAYLLNTMRSRGTLQVVDISDPSHPVHIDACDTVGLPKGFQIAGDKAYIADGNSGRLLIMDLGNSDTTVYFPHAACTDGWRTEIALINSGSINSLGLMTAYNDKGRQISQAIPISLEPWERSEMVITDYFYSKDKREIAYLVFTTGSHDIIGYTKFYHQEYGYRAALPAVTETTADTLYISHIASEQPWWTGIALLNTTTSTKSPVITFSDGRRKVISLAAGEHKSFPVRKLFNNTPQPQIGSATITNCSGVIGFELFGSGCQLGGISLSSELTNVIYYPHIACDANWWTGIAVYDPNAANKSFLITPYSKTGTAYAPITVTMAAGQKKLSKSAAALGLLEGTEWLRVEATGGITGFELFGSTDGNQLGGYTGVGIRATHGIMAKLDRRGWSGIALVNSEASPADVTLKARDNNGKLIATKELRINAFAKILGTPQTIFPNSDINSASYITYQSDHELVGFQLNGDALFLDALPALSR